MNQNKIKTKTIFIFVLTFFVLAFIILFPIKSNAESLNEYQLGEVVNVGEDTGFSEKQEIQKDDPHFNWELGQFSVKGYTRVITDQDRPIFLKTLGDKVVLDFKLLQNIDALNGNESLLIADDEKAYDNKLYKEETRFGRGALIIRKTDAYTNKKGRSQLYVDYLPALKVGANTQVEVCEEGDYEVSLDYSIRDKKLNVPGINKTIYSTYNDYKISFAFSVRNGNCMVFPFDISTGEELTNKAISENGFYLDLAKSKYLEINVKKETLIEGDSGLTEDVRFNRPATDGEKYIDEGIYTIKVVNPYTKEETIKKICVGTNGILRAYMKTGYSISDIRSLMKEGATIDDEGNIIMPETTVSETELTSKEIIVTSSTVSEKETQTTKVITTSSMSEVDLGREENTYNLKKIILIVSIIIVLLIFAVYLIIKSKKKEKPLNEKFPEDPEEVDLNKRELDRENSSVISNESNENKNK